MPVQTKFQELCAAIQMRGWSNTQLSLNQQQDVVLNSRTGCRSWKGTKWGFISMGTPNRLHITVDLPRGQYSIEEIAEKLDMNIIDETVKEMSGVYRENKADRDSLHIVLCKEELTNAQFNNSALLDTLGDIRRLSCL